jgi:hypothetical protein
MNIGRTALAFAVCVAILGVAGCGDSNPQTPLMPPPSSSEPAPAPKAASEEPTVAPADSPAADTAAAASSEFPVTWTSVSGNARQDPIGFLSSTPLTFKGNTLQAARAVSFEPNSPDAKSATGHYTYRISMEPNGVGWSGTMSIVWTMTIERADSRNEFRSIYTGKVSCDYNPETHMISDGTARGTQKTTDTFHSGKAVMPHKTSAKFGWAFQSAK